MRRTQDPELVGGIQLPEVDIHGRALRPTGDGTGGKGTAAEPATQPRQPTEQGWWGRVMEARRATTARYRLVHTPLRSEGAGAELATAWRQEGALAAARQAWRGAVSNVAEIVRLRQLWMVITFSLSVFFVSKQWGDMDTMLIPFVERYFGASTHDCRP